MFFEINVWNSTGKKEYATSQLIKDASALSLPLFGVVPGWRIEAKVCDDKFQTLGKFRSDNVLTTRNITATLFNDGCCVTDDAGNTYVKETN